MFCKNCGAQMQEGMKFCTVCGSPLSQDDKVDLNKAPDQQAGGAQNYGAQGFGGQQQNYYGQPDPNQQQYYNNGYGQPGGYGQPWGNPYGGMGMGMPNTGFGVGIQERSIATCIILTFLTCGFYSFYWLYKITEETNLIQGDPYAPSGGTSILLGIVTCGLYYIYWYYKRGEIMDNYYVRRGYPPQSNAVLYLLLSIFGLGIVAMGLCQNELNKVAHGL